MKKQKPHNPEGQDFDDFLEEQGVLAETNLAATKKVLAAQLEQEMEAQHLTRTEMARRMHTSRASLNRLMDPSSQNVTLQTMSKAAAVLGRKISVALI